MLERKKVNKSDIRYFDLFCLNTNQLVEGRELWLDIHTLNVEKNKGVNGIVEGKATMLLKIDEDTFEELNGGQQVAYTLADDSYLVDIDGLAIPNHDADGEVIFETYLGENDEELQRPIYSKNRASVNISQFGSLGVLMLATFIKYLGFYKKP